MSRVVVIGAGFGGLAVAARLAAAGHLVTVLEAAEVVGGKLGSFRRDGFRFDTGPSLLTMPDVLLELFETTGGWPPELELVRLNPITRYRFADGTQLDTCQDRDELCRRLDVAFGPGSGAQWRAFDDRAAQIWQASRGPFLESPHEGLGGLARLALRSPSDVRALAPGRTLRGLARQHLSDPRLRLLVDRYATYTGSDPRRAPAALAAIPHVEHALGGWYLRGGLARLAEALHRRVVDLGAAVRLSTRVDQVVVDGRVRGVRLTDGTEVPADVVVSDVDAAHLYGDLVTCDPARRRLARTTPSLSGFVLLLAMEGPTSGAAQHTVLFPTDYGAELDAVFGRQAQPPVDPTVYVSIPPDAAPSGCEAWFVLVNAPRHGAGAGAVDWRVDGLAERYADHVQELLGRRGMPIGARLRWREVLTPADLEERTGAVGGAIYGSSSNGVRNAFLRPANRSPVPGLFLVGGSAHPGGGLPLVAMSARIVAEQIGD